MAGTGFCGAGGRKAQVSLRRRILLPAAFDGGTPLGGIGGGPRDRDATTRRATTPGRYCRKNETMTLAVADIAGFARKRASGMTAPVAGRLLNQ
jgi:hypothetical protein